MAGKPRARAGPRALSTVLRLQPAGRRLFVSLQQVLPRRHALRMLLQEHLAWKFLNYDTRNSYLTPVMSFLGSETVHDSSLLQHAPPALSL